MRFFLTDLCGNPIYSFAHIRRLQRSSSSSSSTVAVTTPSSSSRLLNHSDTTTSSHPIATTSSSTTTTAAAAASTTNTTANTNTTINMNHSSNYHHYQSNTSYIRHGSYSQHSRRSTSNSTSSATSITTTLFCLIKNRAWNDVVNHIKKYPNEIYGYDSITGNTALHIACRYNPPPSIIYTFAAICRMPNIEGATPLHIAASHRCSAVTIQALLNVCKQQQKQQQQSSELPTDNHTTTTTTTTTTNNNHNESLSMSATADLSRIGRSPIHYACMSFRGLEIDAFCLLLDATIRDGYIYIDKPLTLLQHQQNSMNYDDFAIDEEDDDENDESIYDDNHNQNNDENENGEEDEKERRISDDNTERGEEEERIWGGINKDYYYSTDVEGRDDTDHHDMADDVGAEQPYNTRTNNKVLVNVMGLKDATGQTPLTLLFRRYRERVRCVINTLDRLRKEHEHNPNSMALQAAITVHADLGQLWEKARYIVARLTEERLAKEEEWNTTAIEDPSASGFFLQQTVEFDYNKKNKNNHNNNNNKTRINFGGGGIDSPGEVAVAQEAAQWAKEQHQNLMSFSSSARATTTTTVPENTTSYSSINNNGSSDPQSNLEGTVSLPLDDLVSTTGTVETMESNTNTEYDAGTRTNTNNVNINHTNNRQFRIVHASVGLTGYGCPPELIRLAISIYPHQVLEMDEEGNLPLHIAVTAASYLAPTILFDNNYHGVYPNASDDHSVLSDAAMSFFSSATVSQTSNPFDKVIKMLLEQYPAAARIPHGRTGQLPLVMAVESKRRTWEDGLRTLLNAYPPALHNKKVILDPSFYPNILALVANYNGNNNAPVISTSGGGIIDLLPPNFRVANNTSNNYSSHRTNPVLYNRPPSSTLFGNKQQQKSSARHQAWARTTLFELIRSKPEWITKGFV